MSTLEDRTAARNHRGGATPSVSQTTSDEAAMPSKHHLGAYIAAIAFGIPIGLVAGIIVALMTGAIMLC